MISVIVPLYNVENYIDKCLESLVHQTYDDLEIILIDDGSLDQSGIIADKWKEKDQRIKVIHKKNGGLSSARNVGLDVCTGEYIMFVDSDDIVSIDICNQLLNQMNKYHSQISICEVEHIFDKEYCFSKSSLEKVYSSEEAICEMWYQKSFLPSAWGKLYSADIFSSLRFTEGIIFEDIDMMHEAFSNAKKISYTNAKLYGYIHHEGSITTKPFSNRDLVILDICKKIMKFSNERNQKLQLAAKSYTVTGAMRVYLNAPDQFVKEKKEAEVLLKKYGKSVLHDRNIRNKTKCSLILFFYFKPLLKVVYKYVNRWK